MTFFSRTVILIGSILLIHAAYSAHEHTSLISSLSSSQRLPSTSSSPSASTTSSSSSSSPVAQQPTRPDTYSSSPSPLPLDVTLETLVSVALICAGIVLGADPLKPITWRVWAGNLERDAREGTKNHAAKVTAMNPFAALETRPGFLDIRAKRKEFADWVRESDRVVKER